MKLNQKHLRKIILEEIKLLEYYSGAHKGDPSQELGDPTHPNFDYMGGEGPVGGEHIFEDTIDDELAHLKKNVEDDKEHISNLEKDIKDDREEEERAKDAKKESRKYPSMMEFLNEYPDTLEEEAELAEDSAPDAAHVDALKADEIEASVAGTSGKLAESDAHMSRGSLYRRRYYGRY